MSDLDPPALVFSELEEGSPPDLFTLVTSCLGEGVVMYDKDGRIRWMNPTARSHIEQIMGHASQEIRLPDYGVFRSDGVTPFPDEDTPKARALAGVSSDNVEIFIRSKHLPEGIFLVVSGRPLRTPDGSSLGAVVTTRDITARRRNELEREKLVHELERSNEDLAQFASVASHDLRAPLRAVANLAAWLEEDLAEFIQGETKEQMRILRSRVHRMEDLLSGLLQYAKATRSSSPAEDLDLAQVIDESADLCGAKERAKIDVGTMPKLRASRLPLQQVFLNLFANAIKHHDGRSPHIAVSAKSLDSAWQIEVTDDGPGIPPHLHDRAFQMFQTLRPRDVVEGTGMGLALVKRMVERMGGKVWIEPSTARGTSVRFTLPRDL